MFCPFKQNLFFVSVATTFLFLLYLCHPTEDTLPKSLLSFQSSALASFQSCFCHYLPSLLMLPIPGF